MTDDAKRFLKAVDEAEIITETLEKLQKEVKSYKAAGDDLNNLSKNLSKFLDNINGVMLEINKLVKELNVFGPTIIESQDLLDSRLAALVNVINKQKEEVLYNQYQQSKSLKNIIYITLIIAALALLFGVINAII